MISTTETDWPTDQRPIMASTDVIPAFITYQRPNTRPPIFVAGTYSDPPWQPEEMEYTTNAEGHHVFRKEVFAKPGSKIQYKFRVGTGNWWAVDECSHTVRDSSGNQNNEMEMHSHKGLSDKAAATGSVGLDTANISGKHTNSVHDTTPSKAETESPKTEHRLPQPAESSGKVPSPSSDARPSHLTRSYVDVAAELVGSSVSLAPEEPETPKLKNKSERVETHPRSTTPFTDSAKVAAEVGESAALLDREEKPKEKTEIQARPRSTTPFTESANIAAEVGESAALLDSEVKPEKAPIPKDSPRSSTPFTESANVAAEVAESAALLDKEEKPETSSRSDTPFTESANIAAEVGESAALLDREVKSEKATISKDSPRANTPFTESANIAAEVGDSAALLDREDKPQSRAPSEAAKMPESGSRSATPFAESAGIAAEVGESAALLDKEEQAEPEKPDEDAEKTEARPRSATPIAETGNTAAEVADTAKALDNEEAAFELEVRPDNFSIPDHHEEHQVGYEDEDDEHDHKPPLFSYEYAGLYDDDGGPRADEAEEARQHEGKSPKEEEELDLDNIDVNDPTLERFPSNREEIIDTVRKIETGLAEDQPAFEGVPPSPIVTSLRPGAEDILGGDHFLSSPIAASPIVVSPLFPRAPRRLAVPRSPRGSISSAHSSALSLQSISEGEEPSGSDQSRSSPAMLSSDPPKPSESHDMVSPGSDEDEGIDLKTGNGLPKGQNGDLLPPDWMATLLQQATLGSQSEPAPGVSDSAKPQTSNGKAVAGPASGKPIPTEPERPRTQSPRIVIEHVKDADGDADSHHSDDDGHIEHANGTRGETSNGATAETADAGDSGQLRKRKRAASGERPETPVSTHSTGIHTDRGGGWFRAFFRLLFVDWIGGFLGRLCGGRRKT